MDGSEDRVLADVRTWLEKTGYPLEMRVARAAAMERASVFQGWPFIDPVTGQEREGDVVATFYRASELTLFGDNPELDESGQSSGEELIPAKPAVLHALTLIIECKNTSEPTVVFVGHHPSWASWTPWESWAPLCGVCRGVGMAYAGLTRELAGYSITSKRREDRKGDRDLAFAAVQQVVSATVAATVEAVPSDGEQNEREVTRTHVHGGPVSLTIPVVVTSGPLVTCELDDKGEMQLRQVERVGVRVARSGLPEFADTMEVQVVTEGAVAEFMRSAADVINAAPENLL